MACIGIDLGTTNSLVAVFRNGQPHIIPNALGKNMTPSVVGLDDDGALLIGLPARERLTSHPDRTVSMFKPHMGTNKQYNLGDQSYSVVELSAIVLKALREDAEHFLQGEEITHVIISVPAYFNNNQRNAVKAAASIAGLNAQRVISEPTAAALSYGMEKADFESLFLVLDLGGGTFDVSLMEQFDGIFDIKASAGNNRLGGEDFLDSLVNRFLAHHQLSPSQLSSSELESIRRQCEGIKRDLTETDEVRTPIRLKDNVYTFFCSNTDFADIAQPLLEQFKEPIVRVLKDTHTGIANIDYLVLVGGASRMPVFRNLIRQYFPESEILIHDPDEAVVKGACIQSWLDANESEVVEYVVTDVCPYTLGIDVYKSTYEKDVYLPIIERNCPIPVSKTTTVYKHTVEQEYVRIEIYQGESLDPKRNIALGKLEIPTPWYDKDVPIEVQLTYDYNGIIQADVTVKSHNIHESLLLQNADALLTDDEIENLRQRMAELSVLPRDKAENRLRIAKLERLYEETLGAERERIATLLSNFHHALKAADKLLLVKVTKSVDMYLSNYQFESQPA